MDIHTNDTKYAAAIERVSELRKFYRKVFKGILAIAITAAINYYLNAWENPWFLWVVFGVSLSLLLRAVRVYSLDFIFGKNWEERKIKEFMNQNDL